MTPQQQQQLLMWMGTVANWQTLTDQQVASAYGPVYTPVPYPAFQTAVMQLAAWGSVRLAGENVLNAPYNASPQLQAAILTAIDLFTNYKGDTVDESLAAFQEAMAALVTAGIVTTQDQAAILALGQSYPIPGVTSVQASDVTTARQLVNYQQASNAKRVLAANAYNAVVASLDAQDKAALANPATTAVLTGTQLTQTFSGVMGS